jgi:Ring finger domain
VPDESLKQLSQLKTTRTRTRRAATSAVPEYPDKNHMPLLQRGVDRMSSHHTIRRHEKEDDESTLPPSDSRSVSGLWAPPPPPALGPEPSYQTQLLLSEMFSQQAMLRNYDPYSIQAVMMALDEQRQISEQQLLFYEDASLALASTIRVHVQDQDDREQDHHHRHHHDVQRAHLSLNPPPQVPRYPDPAMCILSLATMKRDNSSSESSSYTTSSGRTGEDSLTLPFEEGRIWGSTNNRSISRCMPTMEEIEGLAIEEIMPLPPQPTKLQYCFQSSDSGSGSTGTQESDGKDTVFIKNLRKVAPGTVLTAVMDLNVADKKMAAIPMHPKEDVHPSDTTTPTNTKGKKKKRKHRECLICQRTTAECKMHMRKLTCGHHFCSSCIDRWLATKDTCPYCRQQVKLAQPKPKRQHDFLGRVSA